MEQTYSALHDAGMAVMTAMRAMLGLLSAKTGLSRQHLMALHAIEMGEETGASVSDVADSIVNSASAASRTVDRLVEQGLVTRVPDPADRRTKRLRLTAQGQALGDEIQQFQFALFASAVDGFDTDRLRLMGETMQEFVDRLVGAIDAERCRSAPDLD